MAAFSPCGTYRYVLERYWRSDAPRLVVLMLNPSRADHAINDPTLGICLRRARDSGFGRLRVLNLFALRSPRPADLRRAADAVGPDNDAAIATGLADLGPADRLLCAWGNAGGLHDRARIAMQGLRRAGTPLHHLGLTARGAPRHPLYVPHSQPMMRWEDP